MALIDYLGFNPTLRRQSARRLSLRDLRALWRSRRAMAGLDRAALCDVGIDAATARREAKAPFWDVPDSWITPCKRPFTR